MKRAIHAMLLAGLLAGATSGCQSFTKKTVRGQSPMPGAEAQYQQGVTPVGHYHTPVRSAMSDVRDHYHEHHNTSVEYYPQTGGGFGRHQGQYCPPQGYDSCPPGGRGLPSHDRFSYGYRVPNDLVYPAENSTGGAVMYPYYTHKGPSDFFRKE